MSEQPPPTDRFEQAKAHFIEGLACYEAGDFGAAEQLYQRSLALLPGRASTLINLAATQLRLARPADALRNADAALAVEIDSSDALLHRGTAQARLGRADEALATFQRLLAIDPGHALAWSRSGSLLREMQRLDEAAQAFREALRHGADPQLHAYYLASVGDTAPPPTAPEAYVMGLFDDYADDFDRHLLGALNYQAHPRLVDGLVAAAGGGYESALDLGCGTGLCGPLVRPLARRLVGVDLSSRMLDKARDTAAYDRLEQADAVQFLAGTDERYDLVLAADVFIYVGALEAVFAGVQRVMRRGIFCFSVEAIDDDHDDGHDSDSDKDHGGAAGYRLLPSLRYAHTRGYLLRLAAQHGFDTIAMNAATVRHDQHETVDGLFVYLRRP